MPTEKLGIEIEALAKDVAGLRSMVQDLKDIQQQAGGATREIAQFQRQAEQTRSLRETFSSMNQVGLEMMAVSGGLLYGYKKLGMGFVDAAFDMQKNEITLITLLKDEKKAIEELAWAKQFAWETPFDIRDVIEANTIFRSFGLDAREYLKMAADMAAAFGGGSARFRSAVFGVAKAAASGAGALDILRESFGITGDQLRKFGWQGKNDLEGFRAALKLLLTERFAGGAEKLSRTLVGLIEGFKELWFHIKVEIGKTLLDKLQTDISKLLDSLVALRKKGEFDTWVKTVKNLFLGIYDSIKKTTKAAWDFLKPILEFLRTHPRFAEFAGKLLFFGSAFGLAAGAALHFTAQIGLTVIGVHSLLKALLGLGAATPIIGGVTGSVIGLKTALLGLLVPLKWILPLVAAIGAGFAGWKISGWLHDLIEGKKYLGSIGEALRMALAFKYPDLFKEYFTEKEPVSKLFPENWNELMPSNKKPSEKLQDQINALQELKKLLIPVTIESQIKSTADLNKPFAPLNLEHLNLPALESSKELKDLLKQPLTLEAGAQWIKVAKDLGLPQQPPQTLEKAIFEIDEVLNRNINRRKNLQLRKVQESVMPEIPGLSELGPTPPAQITAESRPQVENYYYTIHFERDSVQINTMDLTPEKFQKALFEFFQRHALAPTGVSR